MNYHLSSAGWLLTTGDIKVSKTPVTLHPQSLQSYMAHTWETLLLTTESLLCMQNTAQHLIS